MLFPLSVQLSSSESPSTIASSVIRESRTRDVPIIRAFYRYADRYDVLDGFERHFNQLLATSHDFQAGYDVFCSFVA